MLNKKTFFLLTLFASPIIFCKKNNHLTKNHTQSTIQLVFISEQSATPTDVASQETFEYCTDLLKNLSITQKKRKLTLEEITLAMRAIMFLYLVPSDDYSKHILITLDKKELTLPYSEELLAELFRKTSDNNQPSDER